MQVLLIRAGRSEARSELAHDRIRNLTLPEVRIYGDLAAGPNKDDTAFIALFECS